MEPTRPHLSASTAAAAQPQPVKTGGHPSPATAADQQPVRLRRTRLMGIINITPDSFSDGGSFDSPQTALAQARLLIAQGADILDLGAESTRPGSARVSEQDEWARLAPALAAIRPLTTLPLSIDTYKAGVAELALSAGADWINDIWGLQHDTGQMAATIAQHKASVVIMHNQNGTDYEGDLIEAIIRFWQRSIQIALQAGIDENKIILDPGIGFGKTTAQNWEVLRRFEQLHAIGPYPLLLGASRKSFIGNALNLPVDDRDNATLATSVIAVQKGAAILRVHAVQPTAQAVAATELVYVDTDDDDGDADADTRTTTNAKVATATGFTGQTAG